MRNLVEFYYKDFYEATMTGNQASVLESWKQNAAFFGEQWLEMGRQNAIFINDQKVPIVNEKATLEARERCNREKKRNAGPARAR